MKIPEPQKGQPYKMAWRRGNACVNRGEYERALVEYAVAWELLPDPKVECEAATWILSAIGDVQLLSGDATSAFTTLCDALECPFGERVPFLNWRVIDALHTAYWEDWPSYHSDDWCSRALRSSAFRSLARLVRCNWPQEAVERRRVYLDCYENSETWSRPEAALSPQTLKPFVRPPWVEYPGIEPLWLRAQLSGCHYTGLLRSLFWDRLTPEERADWLQEWPPPGEDWPFFLEWWVRPISSGIPGSTP